MPFASITVMLGWLIGLTYYLRPKKKTRKKRKMSEISRIVHYSSVQLLDRNKNPILLYNHVGGKGLGVLCWGWVGQFKDKLGYNKAIAWVD